MSSKKIKIAIDGPAASGKSTTAQEVARRLNYLYINSGAMYRAVTLKSLEAQIPTSDIPKVTEIAKNINIEFKQNGNQTDIFVDGNNVTHALGTPEVNFNINPVAANVMVRKILVQKQKKMGINGGIVMDGRDISTVVFPDAELKIFMDASSRERARRRVKEYAQKEIQIDFDKVLQEIRVRDKADTTREHGPLKQAESAIVIDTTNLTVKEQVDRICRLALDIIGT